MLIVRGTAHLLAFWQVTDDRAWQERDRSWLGCIASGRRNSEAAVRKAFCGVHVQV
jgi:hypothetical protein